MTTVVSTECKLITASLAVGFLVVELPTKAGHSAIVSAAERIHD
jgi:hypothetical protein